MDNSLSIVVPVHNVEATLRAQVTRLLDVLAELTGRFEVLIVDDASTDQTANLADELAAEYPQIRVISQTRRLGSMAAAKIGMQRATGEVVLVQEEIEGLNSVELRRLWNLRRDEALIMARSVPASGALEGRLLDRLSAWGQALKEMGQSPAREPGLQMIRRQAIEQLPANDDLEAEITISRLPHSEMARTDDSHANSQKAKPVRSFLRHLRELALGE